jgi:hypothetical protein
VSARAVTVIGMTPTVAVRDGPPARQWRRWRGRLAGLAAVASAGCAVLGLDTGLVPLPASTPRPVVAAAGSATPSQRAVDAWDARFKAITATFATMTAGLTTGDAARFLSVVDPERPAVAEQLAQVFANLRLLPDAEYAVTWEAGWGLDPAAAGRPDPGKAVVAHALVGTRLIGWDAGPGLDFQDVGLRRLGDRWVVTSWSTPVDRPASPWSVGEDLVVVTKPHVLLIGEARNGRANARLATRLEAAAKDVRGLWTTDTWDGRAVAVAMRSSAFLDTWFTPGKALPGGDESAWFNVGPRVGADNGYVGHGTRAVLATDFLLRDSSTTRADLRYLLTLDAFVTVTVTVTGDGVAAWLLYGAAGYAASRPPLGKDLTASLARRPPYGSTVEEITAGSWTPSLPVYGSGFAEGDEADAEADWDSSFLAALYVVDTRGEMALQQLVLAAGGAGGEDGEKAALRSVLKTDRAGFTRAVRRWARPFLARFA